MIAERRFLPSVSQYGRGIPRSATALAVAKATAVAIAPALPTHALRMAHVAVATAPEPSASIELDATLAGPDTPSVPTQSRKPNPPVRRMMTGRRHAISPMAIVAPTAPNSTHHGTVSHPKACSSSCASAPVAAPSGDRIAKEPYVAASTITPPATRTAVSGLTVKDGTEPGRPLGDASRLAGARVLGVMVVVRPDTILGPSRFGSPPEPDPTLAPKRGAAMGLAFR